MGLKVLDFVFKLFLSLYLVSLGISQGGMETFAWLLFLICVPVWIQQYMKTREKPWIKIPGAYWMWGFWAAIIISAILSPSLEVNDKMFVIKGGRWVLLIYVFTYLLSKYLDRFEKAFKWVNIFYSLIAIYAIYQFFTGHELIRGVYPGGHSVGPFWRSVGAFASTMNYSYAFGMFYCLLAANTFLKLKNKIAIPKWQWLAVVLIAISLITTLTRGLWVSLVVALIYMLYFTQKKWAVKFVGALTVVTVIFMLTTPVIQNKVASIVDLDDASNRGRFQVWQANFEMIKDRPTLGHGYRKSIPLVPKYYEKLGIENGFIGAPHNNYIEVLSGVGVIGLIFYLGMMLNFFIIAFNLYKKATTLAFKTIGLGSMGAQLVLHVGGMTQCNFTDWEVNHMFIFIISLTLAASAQCVSLNARTAVA